VTGRPWIGRLKDEGFVDKTRSESGIVLTRSCCCEGTGFLCTTATGGGSEGDVKALNSEASFTAE
jgi:hypothetical protein